MASVKKTKKVLKTKYKILFSLIIILLLLVLISSVSPGGDSVDKSQVDDNKTEEVNKDTDDGIVHFATVGDLIAHGSVNKKALQEDGSYDYSNMVESELVDIIKDADVAFANQEAISSDNYEVTGYPGFNTNTAFSKAIAEMGFDMISVANNHTTDIASDAVYDTVQYYNTNYPDINVTGSNESCDDLSYSEFEVEGIKFTFNSFTYGVNNTNNLSNCNVNIIGDENYEQQISDLTSTGDVNIVSMHFGVENESELTEQDQQEVQYLLDNGVEIVIGTHPHVLKPIEKTTNSEGNDALVIYSLGNFISAQLEDDQRVGGILEFDVSVDDKVNIDNIDFTPTYQYYEFTNGYTWDDAMYGDTNLYNAAIDSRVNVETITMDTYAELTSIEQAMESDAIARNAIDEQYFITYPKAYSNIDEVSDTTDPLMLVNKNSCLSQDYTIDAITPDVNLSTRTGSDVHVISSEIEQNIIDLFNGASDAGYNLVFVSGYRPYDTQVSLYNSYVNSDGESAADMYSARPGCSEHQTGLSFDISEESIDANGVDAFNGTEAANWVADNAHNYGFIVRYPQDKQYTTGYTYESWHLRYVGVEAASYIYENNITLDQYVKELA